MQPGSEYFNVKRRTLDFEDYIDIVRRHKSWIFAPAVAVVTLAVVGAYLWPDTYRSTAVVRVVPPRVPEQYVPPNVNTALSQRINSMAQSILSRSTLTNIIQTYNLYPGKRSRLPMEDIVEDMRRDIGIGNLQSFRQTNDRSPIAAFQVSYAYDDKYTAQKVTQDLVSRFINENMRERASQSLMTTEFLRDQWEQAGRDLSVIEEKLTQFRMRNTGNLPENMQANLQQITTLETRRAGLNSSITRANQEKLLLESQIRILQEQTKALPGPREVQATLPQNDRLIQLRRDIQQLERSLAVLKEHYKENHPDVRRVENQLAVLRKEEESRQREEEADRAELKATPVMNPLVAKEGRDLEMSQSKLQALIQQKNLEIESHIREIGDIEQKVKAYQRRVEASPVSEQEYAQLMRERELVRARYEDLDQKKARSETATDLENRKQGETMELLDPASLPQTPTAPDRPIIIGFSVVFGLGLGAVFAGVREMKDTSLKNLKDVRAYTQLAVLGSVPLLENDLVVRRRRRIAWLSWTTACLLSVIAISGSILYYYTSKS